MAVAQREYVQPVLCLHRVSTQCIYDQSKLYRTEIWSYEHWLDSRDCSLPGPSYQIGNEILQGVILDLGQPDVRNTKMDSIFCCTDLFRIIFLNWAEFVCPSIWNVFDLKLKSSVLV